MADTDAWRRASRLAVVCAVQRRVRRRMAPDLAVAISLVRNLPADWDVFSKPLQMGYLSAVHFYPPHECCELQVDIDR